MPLRDVLGITQGDKKILLREMRRSCQPRPQHHGKHGNGEN